MTLVKVRKEKEVRRKEKREERTLGSQIGDTLMFKLNCYTVNYPENDHTIN